MNYLDQILVKLFWLVVLIFFNWEWKQSLLPKKDGGNTMNVQCLLLDPLEMELLNIHRYIISIYLAFFQQLQSRI
jgi:hypothetical protein